MIATKQEAGKQRQLSTREILIQQLKARLSTNHCGVDNAVTIGKLKDALDSTYPIVQGVISKMVKEGYPIGSNLKGVFWISASDIESFDEARRYLRRKRIMLIERENELERAVINYYQTKLI